MFEDGIGGEKDATTYVGQVLGILDPAAFNWISFMLIASKEKSFEKVCEETTFMIRCKPEKLSTIFFRSIRLLHRGI